MPVSISIVSACPWLIIFADFIYIKKKRRFIILIHFTIERKAIHIITKRINVSTRNYIKLDKSKCKIELNEMSVARPCVLKNTYKLY